MKNKVCNTYTFDFILHMLFSLSIYINYDIKHLEIIKEHRIKPSDLLCECVMMNIDVTPFVISRPYKKGVSRTYHYSLIIKHTSAQRAISM